MNTVTELDLIVRTLLDKLQQNPFGQRLYAGCVSRDEYATFLAQTYHYVIYTRPLLRRAGERLEALGQTQLAQLFLHKAEEENGHEFWILDDLRAIGVNPDFVHHEKPAPAIVAFVSWNSFVVEHGSPLALLGAAYVLECLSATNAGIVAKNLVQKSGIAGIEHGVRFLTGHADADVDHVVELGRIIDTVASSPADQCDVLISANVTQSTYAGLYTALASRTTTNQSVVDFICATSNAA